jgi:C-terminal processing protease CtpA/Prc
MNYEIETFNPKDNITSKFIVDGVSYFKVAELKEQIEKLVHPKNSNEPINLTFTNTETAILYCNAFTEDNPETFHKLIDSLFTKTRILKMKNLIIDLRKNEGGYEGYEDYVFSYLTSKKYEKYKYVQTLALNYSFYEYTRNVNTSEKQKGFESSLRLENEQINDGRILRKKGILNPENPKPNSFKGNVFVLTSGSTSSGGSEFASLIKTNTDAKFIGQETGGGYYGNTSGMFLVLILPTSKITIRIPLLKFIVNVKENFPFGRGVIPDYQIEPTIDEYLNGYDTELEFAKRLTNKR